jgi:hypothetical protein
LAVGLTALGPQALGEQAYFVHRACRISEEAEILRRSQHYRS